ncbi:MAG: hypothetical protein JWM32_2544 [Verrucomicrobia bacterium]|nr:hypothetical protein [Verrucomicrobiota bacterium]
MKLTSSWHLLVLFSLAVRGLVAGPPVARSSAVIDLGSRRELFLDDYLVEKLSGGAERRLNHPVPQNLCLTFDQPWEGNGSGGYASIFQDGPLYRMYYTAYQIDAVKEASGGKIAPPHPLYTCYAESDDGISWRKPELGLHEFQGSKRNNIVLVTEVVGEYKINAGHVAIFKDENPNAAPEARYKGFVRSDTLKKRPLPTGLLAYQSADGLHWSRMRAKPVITFGAFDSQNLGFWDGARGEYRAYWRYDTAGITNENIWEPAGVRAIRTATSPDYVNWSTPVNLSYPTSNPEEHLYTNQIKPYARAPHLLIGFPTRYVDRGWSDVMREMPDLEAREERSVANKRYGTAVTEGLIMSSRDGVSFQRWNEAFLRPGIERPGTWTYGDHYLSWHLVETKSSFEGAPNELSLYASESYWKGSSSMLRRYTLRLDGFVSASAPMSGGELVTKPFRFRGHELSLNCATSAAGSVRVEIQDMSGQPLPGFALSDCAMLFGDTIGRTVRWAKGRDVSALAGQVIRLRFELKDADLYSYKFQE